MSWFTDLAGRAEELLNKVDKSAAVAFKSEDEVRGTQRHYDYDRTTLENVYHANTSKSPQTTTTLPSSPINQAGSSRSSSKERPSSGSSKKSQQLATDEKLLEFLNSEEPPKKPPVSKPAATTSVEVTKIDSQMLSTAQLMNIPNATPQTNMKEDTVDAVIEDKKETLDLDPGEELVSTSASEPTNEMNVSTVSHLDGQSPLNPRSLEFENRLIKNEISSLNQELTQALQKNKLKDNEIQRLSKAMEKNTLQLSGGDKVIRELQNRETDLRQALDAKDSQLAVLRVRLQEADSEVTRLKELVEKLQKENQRILEDHSSSSDLHGQALYSMQQRLQQTEDIMERERCNFRSAQSESLQRIEKLEMDLSSMAGNLNEIQLKLVDEKARNAELCGQLKSSKQMVESSQQEVTDYKVKAQRILQSKDKLIASLKEANKSGSSQLDQLEISVVEFEELKHERDDLKEDLLQANQQIITLRTEIQEMENQLQEEMLLMRQRNREIEDSLQEERESKKERDREILQLKEDIQYERESYNRQKATLQSRIVDRDAEIERLRNQLIAKQVNTTSQSELEARLSTLTESLIQKQTILEALSTEKNSLVLQLERLEHQTKDQAAYVRRNATMAVNVSDENDVRLRVAGFMVENPFDGQVTRKVKRVYNTIDTLSFRLGVFLRRYPMARILIIVYMAMLHLWVLIVLLTYTPEAHPSGYIPNEH